MGKNKITDDELVLISKECLSVIDDKKGEDFLALDLRGVNNFLDFFIVATANSVTHCMSLAKGVRDYLQSKGLSERVKPDYNSEWIVVDFSEIVVHIFTADSREFYQLEKLWADAKFIK